MSRHLKSLAFVAALLLLLTFGPGGTTVAARQLNTVNILVSVTDKQGNAVPNLKDTDFTIREDGKQQTIASITNASASPLSVVLLLDRSGSTRNSTREMANALDASIQFFRSVSQPGRDKVALVTFDRSVALDQDFTDDFPKLVQILAGTLGRSSFGGTALHDAIYGASTLLGDRQGRRLILMFGDGVDTASALSLSEAMKVVHMENVEIVAIRTRDAIPPSGLFGNSAARGAESLKMISEETGGHSFTSADLENFDKVRQEMNSQYIIQYQPESSKVDGKLRKIRVETFNKNYKVRHREGYRPK